MTLPLGTALQNGTYVIDALGGEDAIGPVYLATHVPLGQWVQIRILGSRHPEAIPDPAVRAEFYDYLKAVQSLKQPMLSAQIAGFEEDGICYQTLATPLGAPLSSLVSSQAPWPPRQSLSLVYRLVKLLVALRPLGWDGLTLTPDQLWQRSTPEDLVFTGFDLPPAQAVEMDQEPALVQGLSRLLYFLLTGQRAEVTLAPLAVDLRHRLPHLPVGLDAALQLGSPKNPEFSTATLAAWVARLPALSELPPDPPRPKVAARPVALPLAPVVTAGLKTGSTKGSPNQAVAELEPALDPSQSAPPSAIPTSGLAAKLPTPPGLTPSYQPPQIQTPQIQTSKGQRVYGSGFPPSPQRQPWATWGLIITGLVAGIGGLSMGLQARFQPSDSTASPIRLNPNQSFPPLSDWPGAEPAPEWRQFPGQSGRPDYGDAPPRQAQPAPAIAPIPRPDPPPAPVENSDVDGVPPEEPEAEAPENTFSDPWPSLPDSNNAPAPLAPAPILPAPVGDDIAPSAPAPVSPPAPISPPVPLAPAPVAPAPPALKRDPMLAPPVLPPRPPEPAPASS